MTGEGESFIKNLQIAIEHHLESKERAMVAFNKEKLGSNCAQVKNLCVLYGAVDGSKANDRKSFSQELCKVTKKGTKNIS